jgi:hypothetical protein
MTIAIATAQGFGDTRTKFFLQFSVTDSVTGNPDFRWGDAHFYATNVHGGAPVSAVVSDWGDFPEIMDQGGSRAQSSIWVLANEVSIPTNGTTERKIEEWVRILQLRGVTVTAYFWNELDTTQDVFWKGYIVAVGGLEVRDGVPEIRLILSDSQPRIELAPISDVIDKSSFASAPEQSVGQMVPRVFGEMIDYVTAGDANEKGYLGWPMPGIRGVISDENQGTAKVTIRFHKGDGTQGWHTFTEHAGGSPGAPGVGDLWVFDAGMNAYGLVHGDSYSVTNDVNKLDITVDRAPKVWFFVRPSEKGSANATGFTSLYKMINGDATDYQESTVTDFVWSFMCPSLSFQGEVLDIRLVVDWANLAAGSRSITFGIYNKFTPGYVGTKSDTVARASALARLISMGSTGIYNFGDFGGTAGTGNPFKSGRFLVNSGSTEAPAEMYCAVTSASKDGVRLYGMTLGILVTYPWVPLDNATEWWTSGGVGAREARKRFRQGGKGELKRFKEWVDTHQEPKTALERRQDAINRLRGTDFFVRGKAQKDDGSGSYSGTASGPISRVVDIAHYLIHKAAGKTRNNTASTLGNFVDPRSWGVAKDIFCVAKFGSDRMELQDCLDLLSDRFPVRFHEDEGVWQVIPDDMNPHSSRFYRSTSDLVRIEAGDIEQDSLKVEELPYEELVNRVTLSFGHGYPDRDPAMSYVYDNNLAQQFFGTRNGIPHDEPWMLQLQMDSGVASTGAQLLAKWLGQRSAWPRLTVSFRTRQKFYDLKRGHVVRLGALEDIGIPLPSYRAGLLMQHFLSSSSVSSVHDGGSLIAGSGTSETYFIARHQVPQLDFNVAVAAGYTNVANPWEYMNDGLSWTAFANQVNPQGLKLTGAQTISWDKPNPWLWTKNELSLGGTTRGPGYIFRFKWSTGTATGSTSARTTYPPSWEDPLFEVIKATKVPPANSRDYPRIDVELVEVM